MATLAEIADHLDLSVTSVSALKRAGVIPEAPRAGHNLGVCRVAYIRHLRETAAGRSVAYGALDLTAERAALARAQTAKVERENNLAEGELVTVEEVHISVTSAFARVRSRLMALPARLTPLVAATSDKPEVQAIIKDAVYDTLSELAGTTVAGVPYD